MIRKHTKIQMCNRHAPWFAGNTRYRTIECFVEGGPGGWEPGCEGGKCCIWPGTDHFCAEYCEREMALDWTEKKCEYCGNTRGVPNPTKFACSDCWDALAV